MFCYVISHRTIDQAIFSTIDWHYTMAWFPTALLKIHRRLSACVMMMCKWFVYERRHYATMVKMRHGLAILNSNNSVVYGQKHKVYLVFFNKNKRNNLRPKLSRFGEIFRFATKPSAMCNCASGRPQHLG